MRLPLSTSLPILIAYELCAIVVSFGLPSSVLRAPFGPGRSPKVGLLSLPLLSVGRLRFPSLLGYRRSRSLRLLSLWPNMFFVVRPGRQIGGQVTQWLIHHHYLGSGPVVVIIRPLIGRRRACRLTGCGIPLVPLDNH